MLATTPDISYVVEVHAQQIVEASNGLLKQLHRATGLEIVNLDTGLLKANSGLRIYEVDVQLQILTGGRPRPLASGLRRRALRSRCLWNGLALSLTLAFVLALSVTQGGGVDGCIGTEGCFGTEG